MKPITETAIIGAGIMGHGIAQLFATAGYSVCLYDLHEEILRSATASIEKSLSLFAKNGLLSQEQVKEALDRISFTTDLAKAVERADFITEAIPEKVELKWDLYEKIEQLAPEDAILASNTSTIPISRLARFVKRPQRMVITHYFNPAYLVPLVEIVKHEATTDDVVASTLATMKRIGKAPVLLKKEVPGFIANRLQAAVVREAFHLLEEGVAEPEDLDTAMKEGPGFRWAFIGPFETVDFGGLDTWQKVMDNLSPELCNEAKAPEAITRLVEEGKLGVKTGSGIYPYTARQVERAIKLRDSQLISLLARKMDGIREEKE